MVTWEHWEPLRLDGAGEAALKLVTSQMSSTALQMESERTGVPVKD